jgi:NAD(P)H-flavin reductase
VLADYPNLEPFEVYAAGPPALIEAIRATFPHQEKLFFDSFDYADDGIAVASPADDGIASDSKPLP